MQWRRKMGRTRGRLWEFTLHLHRTNLKKNSIGTQLSEVWKSRNEPGHLSKLHLSWVMNSWTRASIQIKELTPGIHRPRYATDWVNSAVNCMTGNHDLCLGETISERAWVQKFTHHRSKQIIVSLTSASVFISFCYLFIYVGGFFGGKECSLLASQSLKSYCPSAH